MFLFSDEELYYAVENALLDEYFSLEETVIAESKEENV